ncbi:cell wall protein DAN4-like [Lactuca sativa]|uniref:cell wall protein DAN4-like n=1 Tax=Lactuca sativa TaxID=4236 RepID=UPI000CD81DB3|nr:cell wall protein DAN4-like [Lactuca sativa]
MPRTLTPSVQEDSQSNTISDISTHEQDQHEHDDTAATSQPIVSQSTPTQTNHEVTFSMPTSVPISDDFFQDFTPPSPTTTTTLISIAPCPNVSMGVSQPQASIPPSTPLFTDSTTTTTTTTSTPPISVTVSDTGAGASGFTLGHESTPISPLRQGDPDTVFGYDVDDFEAFTYIPFTIQDDSNDDAPITKGQLKALNEKMDSLLESTKASSHSDYSQEAVKAFFETLTKEHFANLDKTNQAIENSASVCKETTEKVDKLLSDVKTFMVDYQTSLESNTTKANQVISNLRTTLHNEKAALEKVRTGLQTDNTKFQTSITSKIEKLHEDLALENKIMDDLVVKTKKVKVLSVKLANANHHIDELKFKKAVMKSCIADVNAFLSNLIEMHDSQLMIFVRIEGVSESGTLPKQGGDNEKQSAKEPQKAARTSSDNETKSKGSDPKDNVTSGSKGKENIIDDDNEEEEGENSKLKRKVRDAVLDENLRIAREAEAREKELCDAQITIEAKKVLIPACSVKRILTEAVDNPRIHWLEPVTSFDLENTLDSQLDFPITPKAFMFWFFERILNAPDSDENVNKGKGKYH